MVVIAWVILLCACVRYILCGIAVRMRVSLAVRLVRAIGLLSRTVRGFCGLPLICIARDDCGAVAVVVADWVQMFFSCCGRACSSCWYSRAVCWALWRCSCEGGVGEVHLWSGVVDNKVFNMSDTSTYIRLVVIKVWLVIACCRLLDSRARWIEKAQTRK